MEKRADKRIPYSLDAKIISAGNTYDGCIENVSAAGIEYLMTSVVETPKHFIPDKIIEINFQIPSGEMLHLNCQVKWYLEVDPHDRKVMLGMKIIDPHQKYRALLKNLSD